MSTKTLRWLGVVLPLVLWAFLAVFRVYLAPFTPTFLAVALELAVVVVFGALFSNWVADRFDAHETRMAERTAQLAALREATLALTTEVELETVLQRAVDLSCQLAGARYAALGVLDESGNVIAEFHTAGITPEERARMGDPPQGHGLLGAILAERRPMRVDHIAADPRSVGFPEDHPVMSTLLGVPIMSKGRIFGNLYLTDKLNPQAGGPPLPFTDQDQRTLEMFAAHAAVAIENAQLFRQNRELVIMRERERFGMNLHDGIIQSIYALGLLLDDAYHRADDEPQVAKERIGVAVKGLNDVIRDIRSYIMDLRPLRFEGRSLQQGLEDLAKRVRAHSLLQVHLDVDQPAAAAATPAQADEILHVAQEALTNIQKHAQAEQVDIHLTRSGSRIYLTILDNGRGFDVFRAAAHNHGHGLRNMQDRARALQGEFEIESLDGQGTRIVLSVPLTGRARAA
jgi:signal transduction histidine kinase